MFLIIFFKYWLFIEFLNWILHLFIYINIFESKILKYKNSDTEKVISIINKLSKEELEYVIGGCIIYDKIRYNYIDISKLDIKCLTKKEIINLIGYSIFGLDIKYIYYNKKYPIILKLLKKIEEKLGYEFKSINIDRYLYRSWGNNFIKFSFRPLILQLPLRMLMLYVHILFTVLLGFKWERYNKIGFLSKEIDNNKKNLIFIHGLGFGYLPYYQTLIELDKKYNLIIVVLPNISSYNYYYDIKYAYFPPLIEISNTFYKFLEVKGIKETILISHSFGTYITQILRKDIRSKVLIKIILVDPIIFWIGCFKMSLHIENPFIKKYPFSSYLFDNLLSFLIYQCLYLKYVCFRVMFGPDFLIYDADELVNTNITIVLQKGDFIIPVEIIYEKIKDKLKYYYLNSDDMCHGTILRDTKYINELINIIES